MKVNNMRNSEHGLDRALIVRQPWVDMILSGEKTAEMRSRNTNIRGRVGIIEQGTGLIKGEVEIVGSIKLQNPTHEEWKMQSCIEDDSLLEKWNVAWLLDKAERYDHPIKYNHLKGAVTWVRL